MADGVWVMDDEGNFTLDERYGSMLAECKRSATKAWQQATYEYLSERTPYTIEELNSEFFRRVCEPGLSPMEVVDEFVLEALSGDLFSPADADYYDD